MRPFTRFPAGGTSVRAPPSTTAAKTRAPYPGSLRIAAAARVNLLLVPIGRFYRSPLAISQRSELATAFAQGQADRASGRGLNEQRMQHLMELSADERSAYQLGLADPDGLQAPAPLSVTLLLILAVRVAETLARAPRPRLQRLALLALYVPALVYTQRVSQRAGVRRTRALGLTAETAPRLASLAQTSRQTLGLVLLVCIQRAWVRHRVGRWPRASASSVVAADAIRELRRWHDWNAAYKRAQSSA
jgi:hypothetical protein